MRKTVVTCDRCGREIEARYPNDPEAYVLQMGLNGTPNVVNIQAINDPIGKKYYSDLHHELCRECAGVLRDAIKRALEMPERP
jgi:hypothetical protein